jgi:hypothetical protein
MALQATIAMLAEVAYEGMDRVTDEFLEAYGPDDWSPYARELFRRLKAVAEAMDELESWPAAAFDQSQ